MPDKEEIEREIEMLLSRQLEGELSSDEARRLRELLRENAEARRFYLRHCQMHAMLEDEGGAAVREIAEEGTPDNVVPLAGLLPHGETAPVVAPDKVNHGGYAAAACVMGGLIIAGYSYIERERADVAAEEAVNVETRGVEAPSPEEEYRKVILAMADGGSQNRPPTPFVSSGPGKPADAIDFNRDVRPILSDNCFLCHGPSESDRKADLRLDTPGGMLADLGGYQAVVPGDPDASALIERIFTEDRDEIMPPPKSHKKLSREEKSILQRWIDGGAEWRDHWSFEIVERPALPEVKNTAWANNEIDHYILARLEKEGLPPAKEAGRRTLARRVHLDLTGLPPTPAAVERFMQDESEDAYENLVDELLGSERYGEHRARYWLDAARYGDTHGLHLDNYREIWPYRDWVIGAFNANMAFDQFTVEQLAGDLLPGASLEQRIATGFNRCNVTTSEGGSIAEEYAVRYAVDRVETTSTVWMGLTMGCAVCHDHKYDPLTMKDFYRLFAYFNNTTQAPMDGNIEDTPPVERIFESAEAEAEAAGIRTRIAAIDGKLKKIRKEEESAFAEWMAGLSPEAAKKENRLELKGRALAVGVADLKSESDGSLMELKKGADLSFGKGKPFTLRLRFRYPDSKRGRWTLVSKTDSADGERGVRIAVEGQGISVELIEQWPERALQMVVNRGYSAGNEKEIFLTYDGSGKAEGIMVFQNGKELGNRFIMIRKNELEGDIGSSAPFRVAVPGTYSKDAGVGVSIFEVFDRQLSDEEILALFNERSVPGMLAKAKDHVAKEKKGDLPGKDNLLRHYLLGRAGGYANTIVERADAGTALDQVLSKTTTTLVMQEKADGEPMAHMLERGEYDKRGEEVFPGVPGVLPPLPADAPANRLGLARWLVDPQHPLTARVAVNRMWQELFGTGIVKTSENFGTQGEPPSHPELLDWLAAEFVESGWDVKALYKTILTSATYRQSSAIRAGMHERDPENRLLARGPRFRLDAEMIRDQALFTSGLMVDRVGGPSVKPYQPAGLWKTIGYTGSNTVEFYQDHGEALYRRSLYTFWKRTSHPPNMAAFDAPNRESCTVRRERTNTPLQALVLMNDPQFVEAARHLAGRVLMESSKNEKMAPLQRMFRLVTGRPPSNKVAPLQRMFRLVTGRPPSKEERTIVEGSLSDFRKAYTEDAEAARAFIDSGDSRCVDGIGPAELAAWTMLANQLLNLDEVINKN